MQLWESAIPVWSCSPETAYSIWMEKKWPILVTALDLVTGWEWPEEGMASSWSVQQVRKALCGSRLSAICTPGGRFLLKNLEWMSGDWRWGERDVDGYFYIYICIYISICISVYPFSHVSICTSISMWITSMICSRAKEGFLEFKTKLFFFSPSFSF